MTIEQNNLIDSLRKQALSVYENMDKAQVDYDKFKQVADGSALKSDQAQKIYDRLYTRYIYYPSFIKSLGKIKDIAKEESRVDQEILKQKFDSFNNYKTEYNNIISDINGKLLNINIEDLAYDIQDIVDNPNSLTYSYELVDAADEYARKKAEAEITKDIITGTEACIDKYGKEIDMSICRPSSGGGGGGGNSSFSPSVSDILGKKIDDWIDVVNIAVKGKEEEKVDTQNVPTISQKQSEEIAKTQAEIPLSEKTEELQNIVQKSAEEEIASLFSFKVDLSKITKDKLLLDKTAPSDRQQNINYALCTSKKVTTIKENYVVIGSNSTSDEVWFYPERVGTVITFKTNVSSANENYLKVGNKVKIAKSDIIYYIGVVSEPYNPSDGILYLKITDYVGGGLYSSRYFGVYGVGKVEENIKFVINNPNSVFNGTDLSVYIKSVGATEEEISIARAYCPTSDPSSEYYKLDSTKIGFDGTTIDEKKNLTPLFYIIGGISLFFIVKSILKKSK